MHNNRTTEALLARRELASKATPGPWANNDNVERLFGRKPHDWWVVYADFCGIKGAQILQCSMYGATEAEQIESRKKEKMCDPGISGCNAAHIAANSPDVVMADIDEILRLRAQVERLEKEADWLAENCWKKPEVEYHPLREMRGGFFCDACPYDYDCRKCWREAARKAVETSHEN